MVAACSVPSIRNMQTTLLDLCLFFNYSPKRQQQFEKELPVGVSTRTKLVNLCKTRWVARIEAYEVFGDLYPAVVSTLETISSEPGWSSDTAHKAAGLLTAVTQFSFLVAFVVVNIGLGFIKGITTSLQSRTLDICNAYAEVNTVVSVLQDVRDDVVTHHKAWYQIAVATGDKVGATQTIPRRCGRQTARSNVPADTPEEYYRRAITIPFLDEMFTHLDRRFSEIQRKAMAALWVVPVVLMSCNVNESQIKDLVEMYGEDMPSPASFRQELLLWKCKWRGFPQNELPDTPSNALSSAAGPMYPNIYYILRAICTVPVTSCECERSVSVLRRLKTYLRTTMGQDRMTGLALMHIKYNMELDLEAIINIFAGQHPRRMLLLL